MDPRKSGADASVENTKLATMDTSAAPPPKIIRAIKSLFQHRPKNTVKPLDLRYTSPEDRLLTQEERHVKLMKEQYPDSFERQQAIPAALPGGWLYKQMVEDPIAEEKKKEAERQAGAFEHSSWGGGYRPAARTPGSRDAAPTTLLGASTPYAPSNREDGETDQEVAAALFSAIDKPTPADPRLIVTTEENATGGHRAYSGWEDPERWDQIQDLRRRIAAGEDVSDAEIVSILLDEPTSGWGRIARLTPAGIGRSAYEKLTGQHWSDEPGLTLADVPREVYEHEIVSPVMTAANAMRDIYDRLTQIRPDYATDPHYEYQTKTTPGVWYTADDLETYYVLGGKAYSVQDLQDAHEDNGMIVLPDGNTVSVSEYERAPASYLAFPDGTVFMYMDGREGDKVYSRQTDAFPVTLGEDGLQWNGLWGHTAPRMVWQDQSGTPIWDLKEYDWRHPVGFQEWTTGAFDMLMSSLPYTLMPRRGRYTLATAEALPAVTGADSTSYEKSARGLSDLGSIGQGTYSDQRLTPAQQAGQIAEPYYASWIEDFAGTEVGGAEAFIKKLLGKDLGSKWAGTGAYRFLATNPVGKVLSGLSQEGLIEEGSTAFLGTLGQTGFKDYAKNYHFNDQGQKEYYGPAGATIADDVLESSSGGALLGTTFGAAEALARLSYDKRLAAERAAAEPYIEPKPAIEEE